MKVPVYNPTMPLPLLEQQAVDWYFKVEGEGMAANGYQESSDKCHLRKRAVCWIEKYSKGPGEFDAFIPYLAMHYFDRFISRNPLPAIAGSGKDLKLFTICCLSLAWKMRSRKFVYNEFLQDRQDLFPVIDAQNILKMELTILKALEWRMCAVTAFCFVQYFFSKVPWCSFRLRTVPEIIVQAQGEMKYTQFKPSVIAAGAFLAAAFRSGRDKEYEIFIKEFEEDWKLDHRELHLCKMEMGVMCHTGDFPIETAGGEVVDDQEWYRKQTGDAANTGSAESSSSSVTIARPGEVIEIKPSQEELPRRRPGKEPVIQEVEQSEEELRRRRHGETQMQMIQGRQGKSEKMNIPLAWTANWKEDLTVDATWTDLPVAAGKFCNCCSAM